MRYIRRQVPQVHSHQLHFALESGRLRRLMIQQKRTRQTINHSFFLLISLTFCSVAAWGQYPTIGITDFGMQCGTDKSFNCPDTSGITLPTEPGLLRLWDSQVQWADINPTSGCTVSSCMTWTTLDAYLEAINSDPTSPAVIYTFGYTPCWDTSLSSTCTNQGAYEALPPSDLGSGGCADTRGSCTFDQYVDLLVNHCSTSGLCVKNLIKYYELWNEADTTAFWDVTPTATSAQELYDLAYYPATSIIPKVVGGAKILTPSITANGESWMADWVCEEGTNTLLSNYYNIHQYMNDQTPEEAYENVSPGTASSPGTLYPNFNPGATCGGVTNNWQSLPWLVSETNWDWTGTGYLCDTTSPNSQANCDGQIARWQLLLNSPLTTNSEGSVANGAINVSWYWWNATIGDYPVGSANYAEPYYYMQQYMLGGNFTGECTSSGSGNVIITCPFNETYTKSSGAAALWVWTNDDSSVGLTYDLPTGSSYRSYWSIYGVCTSIPSTATSITVTYDPYMLTPTICPA
jgi:hypothetical protein